MDTCRGVGRALENKSEDGTWRADSAYLLNMNTSHIPYRLSLERCRSPPATPFRPGHLGRELRGTPELGRTCGFAVQIEYLNLE